MFTSVIGLQFSLFLTSLSCCDIKVMVASQNEFGGLSSSEIFWKCLRRRDVGYSLKFWQNSPVKPSGPGLQFVGMFFISASISVVVMDLLRFSVFSWFSFVRLYNRIYQFIPSCLFYWHIVADKQSLMILCISVLSVVISPFSFLILLILFSLFFLMSLANSFSIFLSSQRISFNFADFWYSLCSLYFIYFCSVFL